MLETISNIMTTVSLSTNSWLSRASHPAVWEANTAATAAVVRKKSSVSGPALRKTSTIVPSIPLREFTLAEVSEHWSPDDCWVVVFDRVYDITNFIDSHPGGSYIMLEYAGRDATIAFRGSRHGPDAYDMLAQYLIGVLVEVSFGWQGYHCHNM